MPPPLFETGEVGGVVDGPKRDCKLAIEGTGAGGSAGSGGVIGGGGFNCA